MKPKRNPKTDHHALLRSFEHAKCLPLHPHLKEYVGYTMLKVALRIRAAIDRGLAEFSVISPQFGILIILRETGPITQSELGLQMGIDKATMVRMIDGVEAKKYVTRATSKTDRRAKVLQITPAGVQASRKMEEMRKRAENEVLAALSLGERDQLRRIVNKLVAGLSAK